MKRRVSFEAAKAKYVHRYTMEYIPAWARIRNTDNGKFHAPQYRSCREWYENTTFPGGPGLHGNNRHCMSTGQTWPLGLWLDDVPPFTSAT